MRKNATFEPLKILPTFNEKCKDSEQRTLVCVLLNEVSILNSVSADGDLASVTK